MTLEENDKRILEKYKSKKPLDFDEYNRLFRLVKDPWDLNHEKTVDSLKETIVPKIFNNLTKDTVIVEIGCGLGALYLAYKNSDFYPKLNTYYGIDCELAKKDSNIENYFSIKNYESLKSEEGIDKTFKKLNKPNKVDKLIIIYSEATENIYRDSKKLKVIDYKLALNKKLISLFKPTKQITLFSISPNGFDNSTSNSFIPLTFLYPNTEQTRFVFDLSNKTVQFNKRYYVFRKDFML